jgi:hypothetical protein
MSSCSGSTDITTCPAVGWRQLDAGRELVGLVVGDEVDERLVRELAPYAVGAFHITDRLRSAHAHSFHVGSRFLPGLDDDELSHHSLVLVPQQMTVEHVGVVGVGVVVESHDESRMLIR